MDSSAQSIIRIRRILKQQKYCRSIRFRFDRSLIRSTMQQSQRAALIFLHFVKQSSFSRQRNQLWRQIDFRTEIFPFGRRRCRYYRDCCCNLSLFRFFLLFSFCFVGFSFIDAAVVHGKWMDSLCYAIWWMKYSQWTRCWLCCGNPTSYLLGRQIKRRHTILCWPSSKFFLSWIENLSRFRKR